MSSLPERDLPGEEDFPEIPRPGALWPMFTVALVLGMVGLYLMLPYRGPLPAALPAPPRPSTLPQASGTGEAGAIRLAFVDSAESTFGQTAMAFARRVETLSQGALHVQLASGGEVDGKKDGELDLLRSVQKGELSMAFISAAPLSNLDPRMAVLDLPFLFDSYDHADRVLDGPIGRELLESLRPEGLEGLAYLETGFRILSSALPLRDLASLKGRRIRVMESATCLNLFRALGADPVPSGVDRIYDMGRQGFIDGADRSYPTYWDFKLYEVHRYLTETRHAYSVKALVANLAWWDRLTPEGRKAFQQAALEAEREHRERQRRDEARVRSLAMKERIEIFPLSAEERARFRERVQPLYEEFIRAQGSDLVDRIRREATVLPTPAYGSGQYY